MLLVDQFADLESEMIQSAKENQLTKSVLDFLKLLVRDYADLLKTISFQKKGMENITRFINDIFIANIENNKLWIPTREHLQCIKRYNLNAIEEVLMSHSNTYRLIDPSGQKNEKRKWITQFKSSVAGVFYFISLADYNMVDVISGDNLLSRACISLIELIQSNCFYATPIVVMFTYVDILEKKLKDYSFSNYFPDFTGDNLEMNQIVEFLRGEITTYCHSDNRTRIFFHTVDLTDYERLQYVFNCTIDIYEHTVL